MKKLFVFFIAVTLFTACNNDAGSDTTTDDTSTRNPINTRDTTVTTSEPTRTPVGLDTSSGSAGGRDSVR